MILAPYILGPYAHPIARILIDGFFVFVLPVLFDVIILNDLLDVPKKSRLAITAILANIIGYISLTINTTVPGGTFHYWGPINGALLILICEAVLKTFVYWKFATKNTLKEVFVAVIFSTVIGRAVAFLISHFVSLGLRLVLGAELYRKLLGLPL